MSHFVTTTFFAFSNLAELKQIWDLDVQNDRAKVSHSFYRRFIASPYDTLYVLQRKLFTLAHIGALPIRLTTGKYISIPYKSWSCFCSDSKVASVSHMPLKCQLYNKWWWRLISQLLIILILWSGCCYPSPWWPLFRIALRRFQNWNLKKIILNGLFSQLILVENIWVDSLLPLLRLAWSSFWSIICSPSLLPESSVFDLVFDVSSILLISLQNRQKLYSCP